MNVQGVLGRGAYEPGLDMVLPRSAPLQITHGPGNIGNPAVTASVQGAANASDADSQGQGQPIDVGRLPERKALSAYEPKGKGNGKQKSSIHSKTAAPQLEPGQTVALWIASRSVPVAEESLSALGISCACGHLRSSVPHRNLHFLRISAQMHVIIKFAVSYHMKEPCSQKAHQYQHDTEIIELYGRKAETAGFPENHVKRCKHGNGGHGKEGREHHLANHWKVE